ncbi:MAG: YbaK/EbsC family protein [Chloroflexi bacterium]|nr:YbaK/EbsC family protein [Chloroflexota bacterium]
MNDDVIPAAACLSQRRVPFHLFRHPGPLHSLEQAAAERNQQPNQVVRSILFRIHQGEYVLVLIAGPKQISWKNLRRFMNVSRLTMASEDEVLEATGYPIGAVSPLGISSQIRVLVDHSVQAQEEISIGSGRRGVAIIMKTADLFQVLGAVTTGDFGEDSST